jgi:hypothetical protein
VTITLHDRYGSQSGHEDLLFERLHLWHPHLHLYVPDGVTICPAHRAHDATYCGPSWHQPLSHVARCLSGPASCTEADGTDLLAAVAPVVTRRLRLFLTGCGDSIQHSFCG